MVQTWLGNFARNFYGTGPWPDAPLEVIWSFKTKSTSGRLHKDPWGGTSWPGQPSVADGRVYFGSADSYLYCLDTRDGSLIWSYKTLDSLKATPTIAGDRIIASGLDHYIYCLNRADGTLLWKYQTGFEIDGAVTVFDGRIYFGGEDHNFYCLDLQDGALVYKRENLGSMEGSSTVVDGRIYVGTEQGDLYCLNLTDGATIWKARIGADSDSTPAVAGGFVYTAAEDGIIRCYKQATGEFVWQYAAEGGKARAGIWASPIIWNNRLYIGSNNSNLYCLNADNGQLIWRKNVGAPIWARVRWWMAASSSATSRAGCTCSRRKTAHPSGI